MEVSKKPDSTLDQKILQLNEAVRYAVISILLSTESGWFDESDRGRLTYNINAALTRSEILVGEFRRTDSNIEALLLQDARESIARASMMSFKFRLGCYSTDDDSEIAHNHRRIINALNHHGKSEWCFDRH